jgi:hypothetical protein
MGYTKEDTTIVVFFRLFDPIKTKQKITPLDKYFLVSVTSAISASLSHSTNTIE